MAIDKIIQELEIRTSAADKNLDDVIKRLNVLEKEFGDVEKKSKKGFEGAAKPVNNLNDTVKRLGQTIAATFAVHQLVSFGREAVKAAAAFDKSMSNVATLVDTNVESMDAMAASVRELAKQTPVELEQLSAALYDVRSAGISAEDAMAVLEASAQLGVAGLSTTAEAANIMTSAVNAFAAEGLSAEQISDILFKTVKAGKTTLAELTGQFGGLAPAAAAAGISLADLQASTAALTTLGTPASVAQTQLKQAITELQKPGKELSKIFQQLGAKDGLDLIETSGGLGNAFKLIKEEAEASGMTVAQVTGSVETASAILALGGTVNETYTATLADMTTGANAVNGAFEKQAQTADAQFQLMQNAFEDVKISIGNALMPVLLEAAEGLRDFLDGVDTDDVLDFADAVAKAAAVFAAWKIGNAVARLATFTKGLFASGNAMKFLNTTIKANPLGLLLSVATAVATQFFDINDLLGETQEELTDLQKIQQEYANTVDELNDNQTEQIGTTINLFDALRKTNKGSTERKELIDEINKRYGTTLKNLEDEVDFQKQLDAAQKDVIKGIKEKIALQIQEEKYVAILRAQGKIKAQLAEDEKTLATLKEQQIQQNITATEQQTGEQKMLNEAVETTEKAVEDAKKQIADYDVEVANLDDDTRDLIGTIGATGDGDSSQGEPTLLGAFAALTSKASELQEAIRNALASGNMEGASQMMRILDDTQARIDFLNDTMEGLNKPVEITMEEPIITTEKEGEQTIDEWVDGLNKKLTENPLKVKINLDTSGSDDPTDPFGSPEQFEKIQGAVGGVQNAFQGLNDYLISAGLQNSQFQQSVAIFQITLQQAMAIAGAIRAATQGAKDPFTLIASIGTVVGAVLSTFAQVNSVLNSAQQPQRPQGFFEGTEYLKRKGAPAGRDTIPAMLNEGEAVIPTADNAKYPGLAKSWINGDLDKFIYRNWVAPALSEAEAKKNESMADNLAKSIAMNMKGGFDDYRLYRTNRQGNSLLAQIADNTRPRMNKKRRYN